MRAVRYSIILAFLTSSLRVLACPGCKEAIKGSGGFWSSAFNWSIVFMLVVVFSLIGFVSFKVYGIIKREQAATAADSESVHASNGYWMKVTLPACAVVLGVLMTLGTVGASQSSNAESTKYASTDAVKSELAQAQGELLVTFKSETCSICRQMKPAMDELAAVYASKIRLVNVSTKDSNALAKEYNVDDLPCSVLFHNGKEVARRAGLASKEEMQAWLDERVK
jgi:thiol-disulfide isomerase/thioredoxin